MPQDDTALSPDAALIQRRRIDRGLEGPLTVTRCAEMLATYTTKPFSDRTWSAYEQGKRNIPDRELVLMALVVGASPEELQEAGRPEAAATLRQETERRHSPTTSGASKRTTERLEKAIQQINALPLPDEQREALVALLLEKVDTLVEQHSRQVDILQPPRGT